MGDSYCQNTEGSFACICNVNGYGYSNGVCSDIDECSTGQVILKEIWALSNYN